MRRLLVCAVLIVLAALVGPRVVGPRNHAANAAFVYTPPDGFVEKSAAGGARGKSEAAGAERQAAGVKVWVFDDPEASAPESFAGRHHSLEDGPGSVHAVLHHSTKEMSVEEVDLAKLAVEMPKAFEDSCTWVHRRHELRTLPSDARARVGLIEGDCTRDLDFGALGMPPQKVRARKLQLMFPDDDGTSIVTASYPIDQAARWEPLFEATIGKARGVATRVPAPSFGTSAAWGAAGGVLGWLALALIGRNGPPAKKKKAATAADADGKSEAKS